MVGCIGIKYFEFGILENMIIIIVMIGIFCVFE